MLYLWKKQVNTETRNDKILQFSKVTSDKFVEANQKKFVVHDNDLRRRAIQLNREIHLEGFTASSRWIWKFKKANRIVSRKVTKFITRSYNEQLEDAQKRAKNFVESCKPYLETYGPDSVFNIDLSGFNLEIHSGRKLAIKGTKQFEAVVQSLLSITHSYTIQPTVSARGKLLSPLFIFLKESGGKFSPRVQKTLFHATNVHVTASSSGKLTKEHLKVLFKDVFFPNFGSRNVL